MKYTGPCFSFILILLLFILSNLFAAQEGGFSLEVADGFPSP